MPLAAVQYKGGSKVTICTIERKKRQEELRLQWWCDSEPVQAKMNPQQDADAVFDDDKDRHAQAYNSQEPAAKSNVFLHCHRGDEVIVLNEKHMVNVLSFLTVLELMFLIRVRLRCSIVCVCCGCQGIVEAHIIVFFLISGQQTVASTRTTSSRHHEMRRLHTILGINRQGSRRQIHCVGQQIRSRRERHIRILPPRQRQHLTACVGLHETCRQADAAEPVFLP